MSSGTQQSRIARAKYYNTQRAGTGRGRGRGRGRGSGRGRGRGRGASSSGSSGSSGSSSSQPKPLTVDKAQQELNKAKAKLTSATSSSNKNKAQKDVDKAQKALDKAKAAKEKANRNAAAKEAANQARRNQATASQMSANRLKKTKDEIATLEKSIIDKQKQIYDAIGSSFQPQISGTLSKVWKDDTIKKVNLKIDTKKRTDKYVYPKLNKLLLDIIQERSAWVSKQELTGSTVNRNYKGTIGEIMRSPNTSSANTISDKQQYDSEKSKLQPLKASVEQKRKDLIELQKDVFKDDLLSRIPPENRTSISVAYSRAQSFPSEPLKKIDLDDVYSKFTDAQKANIGDKWQKLINASEEYKLENEKLTHLKQALENYNASPHLTKNEVVLLSWNVKKWLSDKTEDFTSMINAIKPAKPNILILQENTKNESDIQNNIPNLKYAHYYQTKEGYKNSILSEYPFKARSYLEFPEVELGRGSDDFKVMFKHENKPVKKPGGIFGMFRGGYKGGAETDNDEGYETIETQVKGTNNFIIVEFELGDGKIFQLVNTELAQNPPDLEDNVIKKTDSNKNKESKRKKNNYNDKVRKIYDKIRLEQVKLLLKAFYNNSQKRWFGPDFSNEPAYQAIAGDFHNIYDSSTLKALLNNFNSNQNNISNPKENTEFILFGDKLRNNVSEYTQYPHTVPGIGYPIRTKLVLPVPLSLAGSDVASTPALTQFPVMRLGEPSTLPYTGNAPNAPNANVSAAYKNRQPKKVEKKLPGLSKRQTAVYNNLSKQETLSPKSKKVLKKLKDKTKKAKEESAPLAVIGKVLEQGFNKLSETELSPCPQLDYLPCFKLDIGDIKNIIDKAIIDNQKVEENTNKKVKQLRKLEKAKTISDYGDKERLRDLEKRANGKARLAELRQKQKDGTLDAVNKDELNELEQMEDNDKLDLTNSEKGELADLREKKRKGTLVPSDKEKLHNLRLQQIEHIKQKIKEKQIAGTFEPGEKEKLEAKIEKIRNNIKRAKGLDVSKPPIPTPEENEEPTPTPNISIDPLDRFINAQKDGIQRGNKYNKDGSKFSEALAELKSGKKTSDWIWYVYPVLAPSSQAGGFKKYGGASMTSKSFYIKDISEAKDYLRNNTLREHYTEINEEVLKLLEVGSTLKKIFVKDVDVKKVKESLTLFYVIAGIENYDDLHQLIKDILDKGNNGKLVPKTIKSMGLKPDITRTGDIQSGHDFSTLKKIQFTNNKDFKNYLKMWAELVVPDKTSNNQMVNRLVTLSTKLEKEADELRKITGGGGEDIANRAARILAIEPLMLDVKATADVIRDDYNPVTSEQRRLKTRITADAITLDAARVAVYAGAPGANPAGAAAGNPARILRQNVYGEAEKMLSRAKELNDAIKPTETMIQKELNKFKIALNRMSGGYQRGGALKDQLKKIVDNLTKVSAEAKKADEKTKVIPTPAVAGLAAAAAKNARKTAIDAARPIIKDKVIKAITTALTSAKSPVDQSLIDNIKQLKTDADNVLKSLNTKQAKKGQKNKSEEASAAVTAFVTKADTVKAQASADLSSIPDNTGSNGNTGNTGNTSSNGNRDTTLDRVRKKLNEIETFLRANYLSYKPETYFYGKASYLYFWTTTLGSTPQQRLFNQIDNVFDEIKSGDLTYEELEDMETTLIQIENSVNIDDDKLKSDLVLRSHYIILWISQIFNKNSDPKLSNIGNDMYYSIGELDETREKNVLYRISGYIKMGFDYLQRDYSIYISAYILLWLQNIYQYIILYPRTVIKDNLKLSQATYTDVIKTTIGSNKQQKDNFDSFKYLYSNDILYYPTLQDSQNISEINHEFLLLKDEISKINKTYDERATEYFSGITDNNENIIAGTLQATVVGKIQEYITLIGALDDKNSTYILSQQAGDLIKLSVIKKDYLNISDKDKLRFDIPNTIFDIMLGFVSNSHLYNLQLVQIELADTIEVLSENIPLKLKSLKLKLQALLQMYNSELNPPAARGQFNQLQQIQIIVGRILNLFDGQQHPNLQSEIEEYIASIEALIKVVDVAIQADSSQGGGYLEKVTSTIVKNRKNRKNIKYEDFFKIIQFNAKSKRNKKYLFYGGRPNNKHLLKSFQNQLDATIEKSTVIKNAELTSSQKSEIEGKLNRIIGMMKNIINKSRNGNVTNIGLKYYEDRVKEIKQILVEVKNNNVNNKNKNNKNNRNNKNNKNNNNNKNLNNKE